MSDGQSQVLPGMPSCSPQQRSCHSQYSSLSGITSVDPEQIRSGTSQSKFSPFTHLSVLLGRSGSQLSLLPFSTAKQPSDSAYEERRRRRVSRMWKWTRIGLSTLVLLWTGYCTARYFIAFRIYGGDPVRSQFALGMAIASLFTLTFFASEAALLVLFFKHYRHNKIIGLTTHSLTYLSSAMIIGLTIINLILLHLWRPADQKSHSIQGRCNWDVDVVWSGTGLSCAENDAVPFGDWLGAGIFRLVISLIIIVVYHLAMHGYSSVYGERTRGADMEQVAPRQPSRPSVNIPLMRSQSPRPLRQSQSEPFVETIIFSDEDHQRRSLSFTAAGQVLSRIDASEDDIGQNSPSESEGDSTRGVEDVAGRESPDHIQGLPTYDMQLESHAQGLPSSAYRAIALPSNELQDLASTFQSLASIAAQEAHEAMLVRNPTHQPSTVHILGSNISRMSTISSMGSREAGSPVSTMAESPVLSRNSTLNGNQRNSSDVPRSPSRRGTNSPTLLSRRRTGSPSPSRRNTGSPPPGQPDTKPLPPS